MVQFLIQLQHLRLIQLQIICPPKAIIEAIVSSIDPMFKTIKMNNTLVNQTLTKLRDTLLPKLISGEVRVKDVEKLVSEAL